VGCSSQPGDDSCPSTYQVITPSQLVTTKCGTRFTSAFRVLLVLLSAVIYDSLFSCCRRFPATLASLTSLNILILDGTTKATATLKLFGSVSLSPFPIDGLVLFLQFRVT
jgi:hypothetical protein